MDYSLYCIPNFEDKISLRMEECKIFYFQRGKMVIKGGLSWKNFQKLGAKNKILKGLIEIIKTLSRVRVGIQEV